MKQNARVAALLLCLLAASCHKPTAMPNARRDIHSYSNPEQIRVRHLDLDCDVLFDRKILKGTATLSVERRGDKGAPPVISRTRALPDREDGASEGHGGDAHTKYV